MKLKGSAKHDRVLRRVCLGPKGKNRKGVEPNIQVITENVLVPITKTVWVDKKCHRAPERPQKNVEVVRLDKSNDNNEPRALLKRPNNDVLAQEICAQLPRKQNERRGGTHEKRTVSKMLLQVNGKGYQASDHFEQETESLPFPCPISAVCRGSLAITSPIASNIEKKNNKRGTVKEQISKTVNKIRFETQEEKRYDEYELKKSGNDERLSVIESNASITSDVSDVPYTPDLQTLNFDDFVRNVESLYYCNAPNLSIMPGNGVTVPIAANMNASTMRCCDSTMMKFGLTVNVKRTMSGGCISDREQSRYSVNLSTQESLFESSPSTSGPPQKAPTLQLSVPGFPKRFPRNTVNRSALTFFVEDSAVMCRNSDLPIVEKAHTLKSKDLKIKYSWQTIGRGLQTSRTLLENYIQDNGLNDDEKIYKCGIKYSWQIIGISTQTSRRDFAAVEQDDVPGKILITSNRRKVTNDNANTVSTVYRNGKRFIVLNNQCTQTFSHKENQTNFLEFHVKHQ